MIQNSRQSAASDSAAMVACPQCGRRQPARSPHAVYRCDGQHGCGAMFDDDPQEGGDCDDRNPAARLEREERAAERERERRARGQDRNQTVQRQRAERVLRGVRGGS